MTLDKTLTPCSGCGKGYPIAEMFPVNNPSKPDPLCTQCFAKKSIEEGFFARGEVEELLKRRESQ